MSPPPPLPAGHLPSYAVREAGQSHTYSVHCAASRTAPPHSPLSAFVQLLPLLPLPKFFIIP